MKKKGSLWVCEMPDKVNPYYGWGWDTLFERKSMVNLTTRWITQRAYFFKMLEESRDPKAKYSYWTVDTLKASMLREWRAQVAHKKKALYDRKTQLYVYKTKDGQEVGI